MQIRIVFNRDEEKLYIYPVDFKRYPNRSVVMYVKNLNDGKVLDDDTVIIPTVDANVNNLFVQIKKVFEDRLRCELLYDESAKSLFLFAENEARKFDVFSNKARNIRNNNIEAKELEAFSECLNAGRFKRTLKPYQILSSYHIAFSQNACNFSVPGSGKTTTVLAAYEHLKNTTDDNKKVDKLVVFGPLAAFLAWKNEYYECYGYEPRTTEIRGGMSEHDIESDLMVSRSDVDLVIVSYGSVASKLDVLKFFLRNNRCMVVLDEAHRIKNVDGGVQSTAVMSLAELACSRVVLTGTPAPNSYVDLYNLFDFIWPRRNIIGYSISQLNNMSSSVNDSRVNDLTNRLSPFFIRIKKSDLGLPEPCFHEPQNIEMSPIQQKIYDAILELSVNRFEDSTLPESYRRSAYIRLRQAASNPCLLQQSIRENIDYEDDVLFDSEFDDTLNVNDNIAKLIETYDELEIPNKFIRAKELVESIITDGKIIIWCEFVDTCERLSEYLAINGIDTRLLYGKTSTEEREIIINKFRNPNNKDFSVVIANPHAVGESISLHKGCHNALYFEMGFNAGMYMQSKDRIHRVGLEPTDVTNYYYYLTTDSVDEIVHTRVLAKEERMLEIIERDEIPLIAQNMDYETDMSSVIKEIIRDYYERRKHL